MIMIMVRLNLVMVNTKSKFSYYLQNEEKHFFGMTFT